MLIEIENRPGLFRDIANGRIVDVSDYIEYETSDLVVGIQTPISLGKGTYIFHSWRFTCAKWPRAVEMQQKVQLLLYKSGPLEQLLAEVVVDSYLTLPGAPEQDNRGLRQGLLPRHYVSIQTDSSVFEVVLKEQPVEGAGLCVHLSGVFKAPSL